MKRLATTALVLLLAFASEASAHQTPADRILSTTNVVRSGCPSDNSVVACSFPAERIIFAVPGIGFPVLAHEAGHVFSYWNLDSTDKERIVAVMHWDSWMEERFADGFAACSLSRHQRLAANRNGVSMGLKVPVLCHLIKEDLY